MADAVHIFPRQQAEFLRALKAGRYVAPTRARMGASSVSLVSRMPPVYEQALRGTCVANAVTALLEYYEDCKTRLSVQYLFEATKETERAGLERNLAHLRTGEPLDPAFEEPFHAKILQLRMLADANGGFGSPAMRPYLDRFDEGARARFKASDGSLLRSCFKTLEFRGTCRYSLWPYAGVSAAPLYGGSNVVAFPPGSDDDAKKHRVLSGLYQLRAPNNVDEMRGILAGANGRRSMPVCVTVSFFEGCDGETFVFPETAETEAGLASVNACKGVHGMLLVGYVDSSAYPGGGYFIVRNSMGEAWGNHGHGKLPYAYVECFALEAGTILQDRVDYEGDGYGGLRPCSAGAGPVAKRSRFWKVLAANLLAILLVVAGTVAVLKALETRPVVPPPAAPEVKPAATEPVETPAPVGEPVCYKVFFSCDNAEERKCLRAVFSAEDIPFPVEFIPQNLSGVLAMRVTVPPGNVYKSLGKVLEKYDGPGKERWKDVDGLVRNRLVYAVKDAMRRWNGGL